MRRAGLPGERAAASSEAPMLNENWPAEAGDSGAPPTGVVGPLGGAPKPVCGAPNWNAGAAAGGG